MKWKSLLFVAFIPVSTLAWLSGEEDTPGPPRADKPLEATELGNEHGRLLSQAMVYAGLPVDLSGRLDYWVDENEFPALLSNVEMLKTREYNLRGMSGLPDHSYSIWDWASGNLTCPIGAPFSASPTRCHTFKTHMGAVNANHFMPQSQRTYEHYHNLALNRARQCADLTIALDDAVASGSIASGLGPYDYIMECEREALLFEIFGQHFLQDSWAVGHMWERWGSSDIRRYDSLELAQRVAAGAGLIHGAEALAGRDVFLGVTPGPSRIGRDDLSSGVADDIAFDSLGSLSNGIGDLYAESLLTTPSSFQVQSDKLFRCSAAGLRTVYSQTLMRSGEMNPYSGPGGSPVTEPELLGESCFGQRATNSAMLSGVGISNAPDIALSLLAYIALVTPPSQADFLDGDVGSVEEDQLTRLNRQFVSELLRLSSRAALEELTTDPNEDRPIRDYASGRGIFESFMGVGPNSEFNTDIAPYVDPALDINVEWPLDETRESTGASRNFDAQPSRLLSRVFHKSHMVGWCSDPEANPETLRAQYLENPSSTKLDLCTEFASRHVRLTDIPGRQSLCEAVGQPAYTIVEEDVTQTSAMAGAAAFCTGEMQPEPPLIYVYQIGGARATSSIPVTRTENYNGRINESSFNEIVSPLVVGPDARLEDLGLVSSGFNPTVCRIGDSWIARQSYSYSVTGQDESADAAGTYTTRVTWGGSFSFSGGVLRKSESYSGETTTNIDTIQYDPFGNWVRGEITTRLGNGSSSQSLVLNLNDGRGSASLSYQSSTSEVTTAPSIFASSSMGSESSTGSGNFSPDSGSPFLDQARVYVSVLPVGSEIPEACTRN